MKKVILFYSFLLVLFACDTVWPATTYYEVWRNTTNNSSTATRIAAWVESTSYDDASVTPGQTYYYWVKAVTADTVYAARSGAPNTWATIELWVTCPVAAHWGYASPIRYRVKLSSDYTYTGTLTNGLYEQDWLTPTPQLDTKMDEWPESNVQVANGLPWEKTWTRDIIPGNFVLWSPAEIYGYSYFQQGPFYTWAFTNKVTVSLRDYFDSPPTNVNASQGTYTDKIRVSWNPQAGSNSDFSQAATGWSQPALPSKAINPIPLNGYASESITTNLNWSNGGGAGSYDVYFGPTGNMTSKGNQTGTTYILGTLSYNTTYQWRIDSRNSSGVTTGDIWSFTTVSSPPLQPPDAPGDVQASDGQFQNMVYISWSEPARTGGYEVWRNTSNNSSAAELIKRIVGGVNNLYEDTAVIPGTTYWYWIKAYNSGGTSGFSSPDSGYSSLPLPSKAINPQPFNDAINVTTSPYLIWSNGGGSTSYSIYFGTDNPPANMINGTNQVAATYILPRLNHDTKYYWRIDSVNSAGTTTGDIWNFTTKSVPGDLNKDGLVDFRDFAILSQNWLSQCSLPDWCSGADCDHSGIADARDLLVITTHWLEGSLPADDNMVLIPAGQFEMGDSFSEGGTDERPLHSVSLDSFYIGKYEITNQQYRDALNWAYSAGLVYIDGSSVKGTGNNLVYCYINSGKDITYSSGMFDVASGKENHPMVYVSWYGAAAYCNWQSLMKNRQPCYNTNDADWPCDSSKNGYRLPTEAQWEYAARGGVAGRRYPWGTDSIVANQANYSGSGDPYSGTTPVGFYDGRLHQKADFNWPGSQSSYQTMDGSNGYGLYDMAGNVQEWCNDWYGASYYQDCKDAWGSQPCPNPTGPTGGTYRVLRGGDWLGPQTVCRVAYRNYGSDMLSTRGFRVVLKPQ